MSDSDRNHHGVVRGIAALFNDKERKQLFRKYLFFLGWVEILILVICWLYQLGDGGQDRFGPVQTTFPWKAYFLVAFLAPVGITFLVGMITVGFNKYFADPEQPEFTAGDAGGSPEDRDGTGRFYQLTRMVSRIERLPFLALLLLLAVGAGFFYKLDAIVGIIGIVGEKSVRIVLISAAVVLALASIFVLILIILNYQLRKRAMEYQYKSQVAERFGLIILEDNTVLDREGKLLVNGKKWKEAVPLLPAQTKETREETVQPVSRPADLETS